MNYWLGILTALVIVSLGLGGVAILGKKAPEVLATTTTTTTPTVECGSDCKGYIDLKFAQLEEKLKPLWVLLTPTPVGKQASQAKQANQARQAKPTKVRTVSYVQIPGAGGTSDQLDWSDVSGSDFYVNTEDYPGLVEVYFEANLKLFNGNGLAYARLYDVTHGVGVQGSDVTTVSQTGELVTSGKVTFWRGKNLIRVQIKSLTTDSVIYSSGRLRIVTEN